MAQDKTAEDTTKKDDDTCCECDRELDQNGKCTNNACKFFNQKPECK
ncbi:MAG TPA: hypothetical protein VMI54_29440 [Polyangiaceae bacterium]|nr:hypothetical protein [Polyangiaceae bacterium]